MGGGKSSGGDGGYVIDKGRSRSTASFNNDQQISRLQTDFLTDKTKRLQDVFGLQSQINNTDFRSIDLGRQLALEKQNRAQALTRGGDPAQLNAVGLIEANLAAQRDYEKQISDLINKPFEFNYNPTFSGEGLTTFADYQNQISGYENQIKDSQAQLSTLVAPNPADQKYQGRSPRADYAADLQSFKNTQKQLQQKITQAQNSLNGVDRADMEAQRTWEDEQRAKKSKLDQFYQDETSAFQKVQSEFSDSLKKRQEDRSKPKTDVINGQAQSNAQESSGNFKPNLPTANPKVAMASKMGLATSPLVPKQTLKPINQSNLVGLNPGGGFMGQSNAL